jgi:glucuronate isomerase
LPDSFPPEIGIPIQHVLFRSRLTGAAGADYSEMAAEMLEWVAQRAGREKWYEQYHIEVTQVIRSREFQRR